MNILNDQRVLILEEQPSIALLLAEMVREFGCEVVGPATNIADALSLIDTNEVDAAILDVKIDGKNTLAVAAELSRRGTPFAFASGNKTRRSNKQYAPTQLITKPYSSIVSHRVV